MPRRNVAATRSRTRNRQRGSMAIMHYRYSTLTVRVLGKPDHLGFVTVDTGSGWETVHASKLTPIG